MPTEKRHMYETGTVNVETGNVAVKQDINYYNANPQSATKSIIRFIEDMDRRFSQSQIHNGLTVSNGGSTVDVASGVAKVGGRWVNIDGANLDATGLTGDYNIILHLSGVSETNARDPSSGETVNLFLEASGSWVDSDFKLALGSANITAGTVNSVKDRAKRQMASTILKPYGNSTTVSIYTGTKPVYREAIKFTSNKIYPYNDLESQFKLSGSQILSDYLNITGISNLNSLYTSNNAVISGSSTVKGNQTIESSHYIDGSQHIIGSQYIGANTIISGTMNVAGNAVFSGTMNIVNTLSGSNINLSSLTASRLMASNGSKNLISSDLINWIAGTSNQVNIADDGDGSVTLSTPQDIHTTASPTFTGISLGVLDVDNININGNTITSTNVDGNIILTPNGNGIVVINSDIDIAGNNIDFNDGSPKTITPTELAFVSTMNQNVSTSGQPSFTRLDVDNVRLNSNIVSNPGGSLWLDASGALPTIDFLKEGVFHSSMTVSGTANFQNAVDMNSNTVSNLTTIQNTGSTLTIYGNVTLSRTTTTFQLTSTTNGVNTKLIFDGKTAGGSPRIYTIEQDPDAGEMISPGVWNFGGNLRIKAGAQIENVSGGTVTIDDNLDVVGTLSKSAGSFKIDHPLKPDTHWLQHSFTESPEPMNIYKGRVNTSWDGNHYSAKVTMPDWFIPLNGKNWNTYEYNLTPIKSLAIAGIEKTMNDKGEFVIYSSKPAEISWIVYAVRHDKYMLENPIVIEKLKSDDD